MSSLEAGRRLETNTNERVRTLTRMSTGERISSASDDAAGLSISEKIKSSIRSMQMASRNTEDGISLVQTAEGGITEAQNILLRLRELSVQSASDTLGNAERSYLDSEFQHLKSEVTRIANTTVYNGTPLLNGMGSAMEFQVGIDNHAVQDRITFPANQANITASALGVASMRVDTKETARQNFEQVDGAISRLSDFRSHLGAVQSSLHKNAENFSTQRINLSEANSRLRDADMAIESSKNISQSIMQDANVSVLAQANDLNRAAVKLLEF